MTKLKESKCERCGDIIEQGYVKDDALEVDVCEDCAKIIDDEEKLKEKMYD